MKDSIRVSRNRFTFGRNYRALLSAVALAIGFLFVFSVFFSGTTSVSPAKANAAQVEFQGGATPEMLAYALNFGDASDFAVFGGHGVTNHGQSTFRGRVGSAGTIAGVPGMPDGAAPESNGQAKQDMKRALRVIAQLPCAEVSDTNLGGKTFGAGVYCLDSANLTGEVTISGGGDANARFIFRVAGDFSTAADSNVRLVDGAKASNVYIIADGGATLGAESRVNANVISDTSVTVSAGSDVAGKTIAVNGDVDVEASNLGNGTGVIEICKNLAPGDPIPVGTIFNFTVTGVTGNIQVPAGACSA